MGGRVIRYVYAVRRPGKRGKTKSASAWERLEVPSALVESSTALTEAARASAEAVSAPRSATFEGLTESDIASVFAASRRGEVTLSGGRFTREPTFWCLIRRRF